ncbi:DUF2905 domain-containing protein [Fontivita pretiosa]|uniref:DUF2905 domain-containing protein n=1 Tax=Fontivita pretiosa TaxID=2989684 RepID=UPI003D181416
MTDVGRTLILIGLVMVIIGAVVMLLGRSGFRGLPGDIAYEGEHVRIYFPIVTSLVLSLVLTLGLWLWRWLSGR